MNDINKILDNYFEGSATLAEQKILENYFQSGNVAPEHEAYRPLFAAFGEERAVKAPEAILPVVQKQPARLLPRKIQLMVAGAAAIALVLLLLVPVGTRTEAPCTVIINGKKVSNHESACDYAKKMFAEADQLIRESYQPVQSAAELEKNLDADAYFKAANKTITNIKSKN